MSRHARHGPRILVLNTIVSTHVRTIPLMLRTHHTCCSAVAWAAEHLGGEPQDHPWAFPMQASRQHTSHFVRVPIPKQNPAFSVHCPDAIADHGGPS
jgi:hypothetical protein